MRRSATPPLLLRAWSTGPFIPLCLRDFVVKVFSAVRRKQVSTTNGTKTQRLCQGTGPRSAGTAGARRLRSLLGRGRFFGCAFLGDL